MKSKTLLAIGAAAAALGLSGVAYALSCSRPGMNATLELIDGPGTDTELCIEAESDNEVMIVPCARWSVFDQEIFSK